MAAGTVANVNDMVVDEFGISWIQKTPASSDKLKYDPGTDSYTYHVDNSSGSGANSSAYFFPQVATVTPPSGSPYNSPNYITRAATDSASGDVTALVLFKSGPSNTQINLTYTSFGIIAYLPATASPPSRGLFTSTPFTRFFVLGTPTPQPSALTGTGTFTGISSGGYQDANGVYLTQGTSTLSADFSAGTVTTTLSFTGQNIDPAGPSLPLTTFNGSGRGGLAGVAYSGDLHNLSGSAVGEFYGSYYGPHAEEFGYVYNLRGASPNGPSVSGLGVAIGKRD